MRTLSHIDEAVAALARGLSTVSGVANAERANPAHAVVDAGGGDAAMSEDERREASALMRVNHVGEVCAQALYEAQALGTRDPRLKRAFAQAAREEEDHLAWTRERIGQLGGRTSLLNPLWYAGAFGIGLLAARAGDRVSLGFMAETERQVERHLASHLERLPAADGASRVIVEKMKEDEARHGSAAMSMGGAELPLPLRWAMRAAARVMTTTAHYV
jgi:ubiquinone biosynthesis monooxygenase Coq7